MVEVTVLDGDLRHLLLVNLEVDDGEVVERHVPSRAEHRQPRHTLRTAVGRCVGGGSVRRSIWI